MAIGTSQAFRAQNLRLLGNFYDKTNSIGNVGYRLNSTGDGTKWLADTNQSSGILTAGTGQIVTNSLVGGEVVATYTKVSWNAQNSVALTYRTSHQFSYIYIDENGALQQQNSSFTDAEYRNKIILGVICHINLSTINLVTNRQNIAYGDSHRIYELVSSFGPIKRSGLAVSAYSTNLRITRAAGVVFSLGCNYASDQFDADSPSISAANPALLAEVDSEPHRTNLYLVRGRERRWLAFRPCPKTAHQFRCNRLARTYLRTDSKADSRQYSAPPDDPNRYLP